MDAAKHKHIVLDLIFVKYISDTFQTRRAMLEVRFADTSDDYYLIGRSSLQNRLW
jgi:type I restriction enzyme M protein